MKFKIKRATIHSLHQEMITNERLYQQALNNNEQFSVLKGFKNILKDLKSRLERKAF